MLNKWSKEKSNIKIEKNEQIRPANITVKNFGLFGFNLIVIVYSANPVAANKPRKAPNVPPDLKSLNIITHIPIVANNIEIKVCLFNISFKMKKPNIAAKNGITASIKRVTAAVVFMIEKIKHIKATDKKNPPIMELKSIWKKFL